MASFKLCSASFDTPIIRNGNHKFSSNKSEISYNSTSHPPHRTFEGLHLAHEDDLCVARTENLKKVRSMLCNGGNLLESLITIDDLQRLSIDYHFEEEITNILGSLYKNLKEFHRGNEGLYDVALAFRLLRQHGFHVSSDVFKKFVNQEGSFDISPREDQRGMLELFEASQLNIGEDILDKANEFAVTQLSIMAHLGPRISKFVNHTLKHPFHTSVARHHLGYYLNHYRGSLQRNIVIEELATSDFNIVRSWHQEEIKEISRWWKDLGLAQELSFARDQPMKWLMWPMATFTEPRLSRHRIELTKPIALVYIIDDIFDLSGSLDELILFTEALDRWDITNIDSLPRFMKICYMALYNITNEIAYFVLKEHGCNPISSLRRVWGKLCNAFLTEAKWFDSGHIPKPEDYLTNALITTGVHVVYVHFFFLLGEGITKESVDCVEGCPAMVSSIAKILRLWDDLGSAKDENQEGFDGSYMECYLKENPNSSMEGARKHMNKMISDAWKSLNKECLSLGPFSKSFAEASLNGARMVRVMYDYDGDHRLVDLEEQVNSLLN